MKPSSSPTLQDVAREAGVSVSLVSHVLHNYPSIRPETRRRVLAAREKLGYQPDLHARNLRARRRQNPAATRHVGLVIVETKPSYPLYMPLIDAFSRDLHRRELHPLVLALPAGVRREDELPASLRDREMDGFLLTGELSAETLNLFASLDLPYVIVGNEAAAPGRRIVQPDVATGTAEAMKILFDLGHTRVALVAERLDTRYHQEILAAFRQAYQRRSLSLKEDWIYTSGRIDEGGFEPMERLLNAPELPTAILFTNIRMAANAWQLLRERGLQVPQQMSLLAFSGTTEPEGRVPIDRMVVDYEALGTLAVKALLERIADPAQPGLTVNLPCAYWKGSTCGAPAPRATNTSISMQAPENIMVTNAH